MRTISLSKQLKSGFSFFPLSVWRMGFFYYERKQRNNTDRNRSYRFLVKSKQNVTSISDHLMHKKYTDESLDYNTENRKKSNRIHTYDIVHAPFSKKILPAETLQIASVPNRPPVFLKRTKRKENLKL